jgi:hypothetical protein
LDAGFVPNSQLKSQGQIQKARILLDEEPVSD